MNAECTRIKLRFQGLDRRDIVGRFDGGEDTSDAGGVLLREVEQRTRILGRLSECFTDHRDPDRIEHSVEALIKQRVLGLCLGYEDLNDHDELCRDRLLALLCDRDDLTGEFRRLESDRGKPLAGKSTLNRLERTPLEGPEGAYRKIVADPAGMDALLLEGFLEAHQEPPQEVILDVDATDDPLHGKQEGRFFHGYYKRYCYLPLYVFCGEHGLVCAAAHGGSRRGPRGGSEGGAPVSGKEPAVHRDFGAGPGMRWAKIVRGGLLRAGRHGESDKGTAAGSVCGPHVDPEAGGESTAVVFLGIRLRDDGDVATGGAGGDEAGAGAELDAAGEIAEDRGTGPGHDAQGLAVVFRELPPCGVVADGSGASASPPASLLARTSPMEDALLGVRGTDSALESALGGETSLMSAGGRSNAPGHRRISAFVTAFESAGRLSNSHG